MLTTFHASNYRNLKSVTLNPLGRVTLISGKNGVGKTALLEALWLLSGADLPELSARVNSFRGLPILGPETIFHDIFNDMDTQRPIKIRANGDWGHIPRTLEICLQDRQQATTIRSDSLERSNTERLTRPQGEGEFEIVFTYKHDNRQEYVSRAWWIAEQFTPAGAGPSVTLTSEGIQQERQPVQKRANSIFMAAIHRENPQASVTRLGQLQLRGEDDRILEFIRPLEPRLTRLTPITIGTTTVIHAYLKGTDRPIPVQLLGEGLNRMLALVLSMSEAKGGLLLVDEIENGLHYSIQEEVFSILLEFSRSFDVQIFATTHSEECIKAAYRALAKQAQQEFAYYRLDRINEEIKAVGFDSEMLETAIEHNMGLR